MKKLALAAAMSAISVSAMAQNVDIYGVVDAGFQKYDTGSTTLTRAQENGMSTGRLGFRGTEDLGGGLKANFNLEGGLGAQSGTLGGSTTNLIFNRAAWVGLSGNFGEVRLGRQSVTGAQDIDTFVSQAGNFGFRPTNGTGIELGAFQPNVIQYRSPNMSGFTFQAGFASGNNAGVTTDAQADQKSLFARYDVGSLSVMAGWQKNDGTTAVAERDFTAVGAKYDFGFASVGISHARGDTSTTGSVTSTSDVASVRVPLANGVALHGVLAQAKDDTQTTANKGTGHLVAVSKDLSKRTRIYAAYGGVNNEANSTMNLFGLTTAAATGADTNAYAVGITHSF